jgi:hypothetical protein
MQLGLNHDIFKKKNHLECDMSTFEKKTWTKKLKFRGLKFGKKY